MNKCSCGCQPCWCGCFPPFFPGAIVDHRIAIVGGVVTGVDGQPVSGLQIQFNINGYRATTTTDSEGRYSHRVTVGSTTTVTPVLGLGVRAIPPSYTVNPVAASTMGLNFRLVPLYA